VQDATNQKEVVIMKAWSRWQDWVSLVLGILLFISPFVFGTMGHTSSAWDAWVLGVIGVILALLSLGLPNNPVTEWLTLVLGIVLFISPWIFAFATLTTAAWTSWVIGVLFVIAAGWVLLTNRSARAGAMA
jgi:uncharacterized membrane protein HdeD (DUF308 family)